MSERLTAEPGTVEFLRQLLEIAQESDHPMDIALTKVLTKQIREKTEQTGMVDSDFAQRQLCKA